MLEATTIAYDVVARMCNVINASHKDAIETVCLCSVDIAARQ